MFTIFYKIDDNAPWKTTGQEYEHHSDALKDAMDWLEDGYIVRVSE